MYKDAMEANSPVVRENCWEWYTSVVKTRMHNFSGELIVFTRWHEEDLIGTLCRREPFVEFTDWRSSIRCARYLALFELRSSSKRVLRRRSIPVNRAKRSGRSFTARNCCVVSGGSIPCGSSVCIRGVLRCAKGCSTGIIS